MSDFVIKVNTGSNPEDDASDPECYGRSKVDNVVLVSLKIVVFLV